MKFTSKQVVAMVCAMSAAVVLAPVGVMAATGSLVNITDPLVSSRKARVTSAGALQVETRPGVVTNAVNAAFTDIAGTQPYKVIQATGPVRMAVDDVMVTVRKFGSPVVAPTIMNIVYYVRNSGTNPCGGTGWAPTVLRRFSLETGDTVHYNFTGPPLLAPKTPEGKLACVVLKLYQWVGDTRVDAFATAHLYQ